MNAAKSPDGSDCVQALLLHGANKRLQDAEGMTALDFARQLVPANHTTLALLDPRIGVLLLFCSVHFVSRQRKRRSQSIVAMLPQELIQKLGEFL